jgi:hypothetical protein
MLDPVNFGTQYMISFPMVTPLALELLWLLFLLILPLLVVYYSFHHSCYYYYHYHYFFLDKEVDHTYKKNYIFLIDLLLLELFL